MKKLNTLILVILIMVFIAAPTTAEGSSIKICVNGTFLYSDMDPVMDSGSVFVPIRFISEELGFEVEYLEETKTVHIIKGDKNIAITIGSNIAVVDGNEVSLDVKPFVKKGRTFVSLGFISEGFGEEVVWDGKNTRGRFETTEKRCN